MNNMKTKKVSKLELEILELEARLAPGAAGTGTDPNGVYSQGQGDGGNRCGDGIPCPQGAEC